MAAMINFDNCRIRRLNKRNWIIERKAKPTEKFLEGRWGDRKYYGRLQDLVLQLVDLNLQSPGLDSELQEQLENLSEQIKQSEAVILKSLRECLKDNIPPTAKYTLDGRKWPEAE